MHETTGEEVVFCPTCAFPCVVLVSPVLACVPVSSFPTSSLSTFAPLCHIHYSQRILDWSDPLPKYENLPEHMGGDGKTFSYFLLFGADTETGQEVLKELANRSVCVLLWCVCVCVVRAPQ